MIELSVGLRVLSCVLEAHGSLGSADHTPWKFCAICRGGKLKSVTRLATTVDRRRLTVAGPQLLLSSYMFATGGETGSSSLLLLADHIATRVRRRLIAEWAGIFAEWAMSPFLPKRALQTVPCWSADRRRRPIPHYRV